MSKYVIQGGKRLVGEIPIIGAKNSVLPILAATVINGDNNTILNTPNLRDVDIMEKILRLIGCNVNRVDDVITVDSRNLTGIHMPEELVREMRSSIILMGAMLSRTGEVTIGYPGGCELGPRPIDLHLKALRQMGVEIEESHGFLHCKADSLEGCDIQLDYPSVGATENIMLAAVKAKGTTTIRNAAREPEIVDLQNFLNAIGGRVCGAGTSVIRVDGVEKFNPVEHSIIPDRIEAGTYMVASAITGGDVILRNIEVEHVQSIIAKLREVGCQIYANSTTLKVIGPKRISAIESVHTLPYPGFPTDMQAQIMSLLSVANGTSVVTETIFENRFKHADELVRMGANIKTVGKVAVVKGVTSLTGAKVSAKDLRGGASLILAGLVAEGITEVDNIYHVERGYDAIESKLKAIGANIEKV
ncbi:UDP-N-acetylglucosamine 1-carboxyvinyltransferase MurA [Gottschalkia acidurici 9a]|uniref:UDP-N-acetylglucosamine 1-carboxyvinyltransferase n=1 Tax=Gottschalkia acidurici (strain ATCC 7906 / DSM 604 / BCRC 14475 / CIP 104303 / KCTC 5404 / NCIMB 10678 / 9a) TaxID=1128398 RepID=K0AWX4_GOTA9|nr:UDP-N-acetylglucosamine 1-carboxyvinyltransferase [Gottschalkia acidurici]AFS78313.1 UDP-N-acetylglucosamine 1-carboxyvinyltransferase MurA [Gottschalkia acidurici 9a]